MSPGSSSLGWLGVVALMKPNLSVLLQGLEVSSKEVGVNNLDTSDSGVGFNTALPLDTDTEAPDQISELTAVTISAAPETKPSPPSADGSMPSAPPSTETKPTPEKTRHQPPEAHLDVSKPADAKLSPVPSPEAGPRPSPSPEPQPAVPKATAPPESVLTPPPDSPKPPAPEPITNGTAESGPGAKPSPDHTDPTGSPALKSAPPKTPEVELKVSGTAVEAEGSPTNATAAT